MFGRGFLPWLWLLPVAAALVCGAQLADRMARGRQVVAIRLASASGLVAGRTPVRYRGLEVGRVSALRLSADRRGVVAEVRLDRTARGFNACDARYWIVEPRLDVRGIAALGSVLSGSYLAADVGRAAARCHDFTALDAPPAVMTGDRGSHFALHAASLGSLSVGAPVYFGRMEVGRVAGYALSRDGSEVVVDAFVRAPFDARVSAVTRWWQASGIALRLDSTGMRLDAESMAAALSGGIAFDTPVSPVGRSTVGDVRFVLAESREAATRLATDGAPATVAMRFGQSLRSLSAGAPVEFHGIAVGTVLSVRMEVTPATARVDGMVMLDLYPARLGARYRTALGNGDSPDGWALLQRMVARGLRGQLRTGSLLTGQQYIALDFFPQAPKASVETREALVVLPTVPGAIVELQDRFASIAAKLGAMPFGEIGRHADASFEHAEALLRQFDGGVDAAASAVGTPLKTCGLPPCP